MVLGKVDICMSVIQIELFSHNIYNNKFKMDWRLKYKTSNHKTSKKKKKGNMLFDIGISSYKHTNPIGSGSYLWPHLTLTTSWLQNSPALGG